MSFFKRIYNWIKDPVKGRPLSQPRCFFPVQTPPPPPPQINLFPMPFHLSSCAQTTNSTFDRHSEAIETNVSVPADYNPKYDQNFDEVTARMRYAFLEPYEPIPNVNGVPSSPNPPVQSSVPQPVQQTLSSLATKIAPKQPTLTSMPQRIDPKPIAAPKAEVKTAFTSASSEIPSKPAPKPISKGSASNKDNESGFAASNFKHPLVSSSDSDDFVFVPSKPTSAKSSGGQFNSNQNSGQNSNQNTSSFSASNSTSHSNFNSRSHSNSDSDSDSSEVFHPKAVPAKKENPSGFALSNFTHKAAISSSSDDEFAVFKPKGAPPQKGKPEKSEKSEKPEKTQKTQKAEKKESEMDEFDEKNKHLMDRFKALQMRAKEIEQEDEQSFQASGPVFGTDLSTDLSGSRILYSEDGGFKFTPRQSSGGKRNSRPPSRSRFENDD